MNLRKLLATSAGVLMLAQTVLPGIANAATNYGVELEEAYAYAYDKGVTTQYPIDNANMFGALTRVEMSKMIANWAEKVVGTKADTSKACNFTDLGGVKDQELYGTIIKSCQMGIMGQGISQFRPFDVVTRAEFGTILSRVLWGDKYDGGTPYYAAHLNALKTAGIMTQITDPENMKEVRGYVMIMLQRADEEGTTTDVCKDPLVMLACALGSDDCPAECQDDDGDDGDDGEDRPEAKGDLDVSVDDYSSSVKSIPATGTVIFNQIAFDSSETIEVYSISLSREGLSSKSDIKGIWFEKDGVRISGKGSLSTDGTTTVNFNNGFKVKSDEVLDLVVQLEASVGAEIAFKITDVDSSAKNLSISKKVTSTYRTAAYEVGSLEFDINGSNAAVEYKLGEQNTYELGKFEIDNTSRASDDKDIKVQSIVLKNLGGGDLTNLKNIKVYRDSEVVSKSASVDSKNLTLVLNNVIESGKKAIYTIEAEVTYVESQNGDEYQFVLNKDADLVAVESNTNFRTINTIDSVSKGQLAKYTMKGGKMVFSTSTGFPTSVDAGASYSDVVIAEGTLTIAEPIMLDGLVLPGTSSTSDLRDVIKKAVLEIGGSSYTANVNATNITFDDEIYMNKTATVKLVVTLTSSAANGASVTFNSIKGSEFGDGEYQNSSNNFDSSIDMAGSISVAKVNVKDAKFNITKTSTASEVKVVKNVSDQVTLFEGKITNNQSSKLTINELTLSGKNTVAWGSSEELYLTLEIGGKTVSKSFKTTTTSDTIVTFTSLGINLTNGESVSFTVKANPTIDTVGSTRFYVAAKGTDNSGNEASTSSIFAVTFTVSGSGSASGTSNTSSITNSAFAEKSDANAFAQWNLSVKDETLTLKKVTLATTAGGWEDIVNTWYVSYKVGNTSKDINGTISIDASGNFTMEDLSEQLAPGNYTFTAYASLGEASGTATDNVTVNSVAMDLEGAAGPITMSPSPLALSFSHVVFKAVPRLSFEKTRTDTSDAKNLFGVKITYPATGAGTDPIEITKFTFTGSPTGIDVVNSNGVKIGDETALTQTLSLNPGQSVIVKFQATTTMTAGTSIDVKLTGMDYTVDTTPVVVNNTHTNVAVWNDLQVNANIPS